MLAGIAELRKDGQGYVYWRNGHVEHYSFHGDDAEEEEAVAARELAVKCRHLESIGVPVNVTTACWASSWFASLTKDHKHRPILAETPGFYEKPGEGLGYYVEDKTWDQGTQGSGIFHYWNGAEWRSFPVQWDLGGRLVYHVLAACGWDIPQVGQGKHNGLVYATTEQVTALLERWKFPTSDWPPVRVKVKEAA